MFLALHAAMADFDANLLTVMSPCEDLVGLKAAHGGLDRSHKMTIGAMMNSTWSSCALD
jgi:hypothetical protein